MASAVTFGVLSSFDHLSQDWNIYKPRLLQWFIANEIDDKEGTKKKAILLSALTEATFKLASDLALPTVLSELSFDAIIKLFDNHCTPKRCGFAERSHFYAAVQRPGEGHTQWAARIRGLAAYCGFKNLEEALLDKFVMGMAGGHERDKLFAHDLKELTLSKAVELAESVRCARDAAAAAPAPALQFASPDNGVFNISRKSDKCSVCGYANHKMAQCRFKKYKCKKCGIMGHLRRMCPDTKIKHLEESDVDDGDDGESFHNIQCCKGNPMMEQVDVGGTILEFEIDSGSPVNVISDKKYRSHFSHVPLSITNKVFKSYTGDKIQTIGCIQVPVTYLGSTHALDIYVVRNGGPPLLGRSFIYTFGLELAPATNVNYCAETHDVTITNIFSMFPKLFSGELGCFNKYEIKLYLKPDSKPIFFKARPVAFALKDKVDQEIDRLLELGVLKSVEHSEYASPVVPVLKNNGSVRLCADYSVTINKHLIIEKYPLPTIDEMFSKLHGGRYFTKLDLSMAYNQFLLSEESQNFTCINTHRGLYKFTRMVFGLSSAPAIFQRAMECVLAGMDGVLCFQDDILISSVSKSQNIERLIAVLQRLQDAGLTLQKNKCEFFKTEVSYLGHVIDANGIRKSDEKVKAIVDTVVPANVLQLQSFLGLVNYYRNFIPGASSILSPLYNLLQKNCKWEWTSAHDDAFRKIKCIFASDQILTHFDSNAKLILTVDASPTGLGAVLSQICSDGLERPISFASRTLTAAEKKYSQIQKEATAIIFGVRRYHKYLYGRADSFILRSDHKPLITIFGSHKGIPEVSANRLQRYAIFLSAYNYTIEYIRSVDNSADYLSRATLPSCDKSVAAAAAQAQEEDRDCEERAAYVNFVTDGCLPVTLSELRTEVERDQVIKKVINYVQKGWPRKITDPCLKPYFNCRFQFSFENGCLMRGHKIVIPVNLRDRICKDLHSSHFGVVKMKAAARARFWFPGIDAVVEQLARECAVCAQLRPDPPRAPLAPWPFPPHPFYRIHLDFLGPFNNRMYLIVVDAHSKWVECYIMHSSYGSTAVIAKLYDLMSRVGIPHTIVTDNGTSFTSKEFKDFCNLNGVNHVLSPPYHPSSNGQAESLVKVVKKGLNSIILSSGSKAVTVTQEQILKFLFDYRNSKNSTTDKSPAEILYGRPLRSRFDILRPLPVTPSSTDLTQTVGRNQSLQAKHYKGTYRPDFQLNDKVWVKRYLNNKKHCWIRGIVKQTIGNVIYLIYIPELDMDVKKHKNQIKIRYEMDPETSLRSQHSWDPDIMEGPAFNLTNDNAPSLAADAAASHQSVSAQDILESTSTELTPLMPVTPEGESQTETGFASPTFSTPTAQVQGAAIQEACKAKRNRPTVDYTRFF